MDKDMERLGTERLKRVKRRKRLAVFIVSMAVLVLSATIYRLIQPASAMDQDQADFTVEFEYFLHQQNKLRSITPRSISLLNRNLDCLDTKRQSLRSDRLSIRFPFRPT